jgi:hypothetical protein
MQKSLFFAAILGAASLHAGTVTFGTIALNSVEGSPFSGILASFTNTVTSDPAGDYTATINWGDGTTAVGSSITGGGGSFNINATHTYTEEGSYIVAVSVTDSDGNGTTGGSGTATVSDAPLTLGTVPMLTFNPGVAGTNVLIANFNDSDSTTSSTGDYTATINWGDGSPTTGGSFTGTGGSYGLLGSHTYAASGAFTIDATVNDVGGSSLTFTSQALVTPEPGSIAMVCAGLALVGFYRGRKGRCEKQIGR